MNASAAIHSVPFEERLLSQRNGYESFRNKEERGNDDCVQSQYALDRSKKTERNGRVSKNHPIEVTSKRPVPRFRQILDVKNKQAHDPRFDPLCGKLNQDLFEKSYAFLSDLKENEVQMLRKQIQKSKSKSTKENLQTRLKELTQEMSQAKKQEKVKSALMKRKKEEKEAVIQGKKPFYMNRKEKKQVELEAKFQDLQESGKLSKFMAKKRRKNANKDHRWLPRKTT